MREAVVQGLCFEVVLKLFLGVAARLQAANGSDNPILFRVDYESGHRSDAKTKSFEEFADIMSFSFWQMGHPDYQSIKQKEKSVD